MIQDLCRFREKLWLLSCLLCKTIQKHAVSDTGSVMLGKHRHLPKPRETYSCTRFHPGSLGQLTKTRKQLCLWSCQLAQWGETCRFFGFNELFLLNLTVWEDVKVRECSSVIGECWASHYRLSVSFFNVLYGCFDQSFELWTNWRNIWVTTRYVKYLNDAWIYR